MRKRTFWQKASKIIEKLIKLDVIILILTALTSYVFSKFLVMIVRFMFDGDILFKVYKVIDSAFKTLPSSIYNITMGNIPEPHTNKWGDHLESFTNNLGQGFMLLLIVIGLVLIAVYVITIIFRHHNGEISPFLNDREANKLKKSIIKSTNSRWFDKSKGRSKKADTWNVFKWYFDKEVRDERNARKDDRISKKAIRRGKVYIETRIDKGQVAPQKKYEIIFVNPTHKNASDKLHSKIKDLHKTLIQLTKVTFDEIKTKEQRRYYTFEGSVEKELKEARSVVKKRNNGTNTKNNSSNAIDTSFEGNFPLELLEDKSGKIEEQTIEAQKYADEKVLEVSEYLANEDIQAELVERNIGNGSIGFKYKIRYTKMDKKSINKIQNGLKDYLGIGSVIVYSVPSGLDINVGLVDEYVGIDKKIDIDNRKAFRENLSNVKNPTETIFGVEVSGKVFTNAVAKAPHLIVAGSTGSGKSVGVNYIVTSISWHASKELVEFVFIDPKQLEFMVYKGHPYNKVEPITEPEDAIVFLKYMTYEMKDRNAKMAKVNAKSIESYNKKAEKQGFEKMKECVIVIDEYADLVQVAKEVEDYVKRLAQMGRACGIYILLATQRPSVDVLPGVIKNNMPTRLAYALSSGTDSKVTLDDYGAENLNGKGDSLLKWNGSDRFIRMQGGFLTEEEIENIVEHLKETLEPNVHVDYKARVAREEGEDEDEDNANFAAVTSLNSTLQDFEKDKKQSNIESDNHDNQGQYERKESRGKLVKTEVDPTKYLKDKNKDEQVKPVQNDKVTKSNTRKSKEEMSELDKAILDKAIKTQEMRRKKKK